MKRRTIIAAIAAGAIGVAAPGCGGGGDRESIDQSNQGELDPQGGSATQQAPADGITPTGETQETVTQPETGE
jgi:hypothetical protein